MTHLVILFVLFFLLCLQYYFKPQWTYLILFPLIILGGLIGAQIPFQNLIEGMFGYVTELLTVLFGAIFVYVLVNTGSLEKLIAKWIQISRKNRFLMLLGMGIIGLIPGLAMGSALVSYLVLSILALPILKQLKMTDVQGKSFLLTISALGMIAPPVNLPLLIMNKLGWGAITGVYPFLWLLVIPGVIFTALLFMRFCSSPSESDEVILGAKESVANLCGIIIVIGLLVLRQLFPYSALGQIGLPLIFIFGAIIHWLVCRAPQQSFMTISLEALASVKPLLLLLVGCSLAIQVSKYTAFQNIVVAATSQIPAVYSITLLIIAGLLFGSLWEGLATLVILPAYIVNSMSAYHSAVVTSSAIFTAVIASIISIGILIPAGWKRTVINTGPFEKGMGRLTFLPALFMLVWCLLVYWKIGSWLSQIFIN